MQDPLLDPGAGAWTRGLDVAAHLVLPAATLVIVSIASTMRYQRRAMLEVLPLPYIVAARARGLAEPVSAGLRGVVLVAVEEVSPLGAGVAVVSAKATEHDNRAAAHATATAWFKRCPH